MLLLAAALTPILIFAGAQAAIEAQQSLKQRQDQLALVSDRAVERVDQVLATAETTLDMFEEDIASGACKSVHERVTQSIPMISNTLQFDRSGTTICEASEFAPLALDATRFENFRNSADIASRSQAFRAPNNEWIIGLYRKVFDSAGNFDGLIAFSLRLDGLNAISERFPLEDGVEIALADETGRVFGSDRFSQIEPYWIDEVTRGSSGAFFVEDVEEADKLDIVLRPIGREKIYALISRPSPGLFSEFSVTPATSIGIPLLAFSITLLAVWLALDRLVLRWLARLRAMARAYGAGAYDIQPTRFEDAPQEFSDLANSMQTMAGQISERDASLQAAIDARDASVKEIHHRVKNNLQIVTSFLNLQSRKLKDPQAEAALAAARHRINALSIVHQTLYQHERLERVDIRPFLTGLLDHLSEALGMDAQNVTLTYDLDDGSRSADDAIPMALFTLEAVTNAMKYAFDDDGGTIDVTFKESPDSTVLTISDNGRGVEDASTTNNGGTGLGTTLMKAFARQLGGELTQQSMTADGFTSTLTIPN